MIGNTSDLKDALGINDISPQGLDSFVDGDYGRKYAATEKIVELARQGNLDTDLLIWALVATSYSKEGDILRTALKSQMGEEDARLLENARLTAWRSDLGSLSLYSYQGVLSIFNFLKELGSLNLSPDDMTDCRSVEEMREKLRAYNRLTIDRLEEFYSKGVEMFPLGRYKVRALTGFLEHQGGFCLYVTDCKEPYIVYVSGKLHNKRTHVISIHGKRDGSEDIHSFREEMEIHPANLALLMYLEIARLIGNCETNINGKASTAFNFMNKDSLLYQIPRNYFRLRVNPQSRMYEFDTTKRDIILEKFFIKNNTVRLAFECLREYLS